MVKRTIPERITDESVDRIIKAYEDAYKDIHRKLKVALDYKKNPNFSQTSIYSINKYIESRLRDLRVDINNVVPKELRKAVEVGYTEQLMAQYLALGINKSFNEAWKDVPFSRINDTIGEQMAKDTMTDLLQITNNTEYAVKKFVRDTFSKHMAVQSLQNAGRKDMIKVVMKDLTGKRISQEIENNMIAIVDKAGRKWKLDTYVDMVVRTKFHQARVEGIKEYINDTGKGDLAQIPIHNALDECREFEGLVISMTGVTEGYRSYEELKATNKIFHPRCKHVPKPVYALEYLHDDDIELHNKKVKTSDNFLEKINK